MTKQRLQTSGLLAICIVFMVYPLAHVLLRAFFADGAPSLAFFRVMADTEFYREVIFNSLNLAIIVTLLTSALGYPLAFVLARYKLPASGLIHSALLLPLVVPPFVGVLGVRQLFSRFGTVNVILMDLGIVESPVDWLGGGGVVGIIALQTLHLVPILYLSLRASLQNTHITLEEAALMSGASRLAVVRKIILPLSLPGWFAGATLVFIGSFTDLGTPLIFEYRKTISVQIYNMLTDLNENPVGYSFVVFTCVLSVSLFLLSKVSLLRGSFASTGRGIEQQLARPLSASARAVILSALALYLALALLPQASLVLLSLSGDWFMTALPSAWTLHHFREVLNHPITAHSLITSLWLSLVASALTVVVGFLMASIVVRGRGPMRTIMEAFSIIPLAVPGIVFAFGYAGGFAGTPLDNRINPFPLLIAAYMIRRLPAMVRSASAGLEEASRSLEEAGLMVGASPFAVTRHIVFPLIGRHILVGALLTFAYSMIEVSDGLLLALEERFYPVSKAIYALMGRPDGMELAAALGVIVMLIMMACFYGTELISRRGAARRTAAALATLLLLFPAAARADEDEVVIVSSHWEGMKREFEWAFTNHYRERTGRTVAIRWLDLGGSSDIVKYLKGQFKRDPKDVGVDLMFSGGPDIFLDLKESGMLAPATVDAGILTHIPQSISGVPLYDPDHYWFSAALSTFGIVYNKVAIERLKLPTPTAWADLAKAEYFGKVGAGDPRKSGSMHAMYEVILQGYGWEAGWKLLQHIASNVRNFSGGASQVGKEVAAAEIIVGIAIDTYGADVIRRFGADRIGFVVPQDYPAINGDGIGIIRNAPHPQLASSFIEFVLSEAGQKLFYAKRGEPGGPRKYELGKLPVLPSLYGTIAPSTVVNLNPFTMPNVLLYRADVAAKRWNLVNDLFGAFIMDSHDTLVQRAALSPAGSPATFGIPVSESEAARLLEKGAWGADATARSEKLREWGSVARAGSRSALSRLAWLPSTLLACLLCLAVLRRLFRLSFR
jgi:iron(III) transport system permease protein